jgi:plasmid stabilization system protein ParE
MLLPRRMASGEVCFLRIPDGHAHNDAGAAAGRALDFQLRTDLSPLPASSAVRRRYVLTPEAQAHINEIGAYIARDSVDAALKVYDALEEAFELLAERPGVGRGSDRSPAQVLERLFVSRRLRPWKPTAHDYCGSLRRSRCQKAAEALILRPPIITNGRGGI